MKTPVVARLALVALWFSVLFAIVRPASAQMPAAAAPDHRQPVAAAGATSFRLVLDPALVDRSYGGRVYVVFSTRDRGEPRRHLGNWMQPAQMLVADVADVPVGGTIDVTEKALGFPKPFAEIPDGEYTVQAIARRSLDCPNPGFGEGDLYSKPERVEFMHAGGSPVELRLTEVAHARPFAETERLKLVEIKSDKLSAFHGREVKIRAGVWLPVSWKADSKRIYPVLYSIPGFGGDHRIAGSMGRMVAVDSKSVECIFVVPDPTC
ncbi:MAG TPA: hypothetical protein VHC70_10085, partial [Phycisphaerales bacterium]|nr:hypothetical protein [Phycisphaerales bacterium]